MILTIKEIFTGSRSAQEHLRFDVSEDEPLKHNLLKMISVFSCHLTAQNQSELNDPSTGEEQNAIQTYNTEEGNFSR